MLAPQISKPVVYLYQLCPNPVPPHIDEPRRPHHLAGGRPGRDHGLEAAAGRGHRPLGRHPAPNGVRDGRADAVHGRPLAPTEGAGGTAGGN